METQPETIYFADGSKSLHEEQNEDCKWDWYAGGMIIRESKIHLVTVHQAFLVMDTFAWAAAHATAHEEAAETATTDEARSINERVAHSLRRWLEGDADYLEPGFPLWALVPAIAFRAKIGILVVEKANFAQYMTRLLARTISARPSVPPAFILMADTERPCIWATADASYMVDFASPGVVTEIVSQDQLWYNFQQFVRAYEMAPPDLSSTDQAVKNRTGKSKSPVKSETPVKGEDHAMTALYEAWGVHREVKGGDLLVQEFLYSIFSGSHSGPDEAVLDDTEAGPELEKTGQDPPARRARASRRHSHKK